MESSELYKVSAQEARVQLSDMLNKAIYGQQPSLITRQGKPAAVLISFEQWQAFQQAEKIDESTASSESSLLDEATQTGQQPNNTGEDEQNSESLPIS